MKQACFEDGPRFSGAKRTETDWADGVFLLHAGRKGFFDTLKIFSTRIVPLSAAFHGGGLQTGEEYDKIK